MSSDKEVLSPAVPAPDRQHSIVSETYWKSLVEDGAYCVLAVAGSGVKIYIVVDKDCNVRESANSLLVNGRQLIERFEQLDCKNSSKQWRKVETNVIPEPIFGSLHSMLATLAQSL